MRGPCAPSSRRNAGQRDSLPGTRYNRARAKPRRANERKGSLSNGSNKTTVRNWVSSRKRKGVGDPLAGAGDCSRRHDETGAAIRNTRADVAPQGVRDSGSKGGGIREQGADAVARHVSHDWG